MPKRLREKHIRFYRTIKPRYLISKDGRAMVCGIKEIDLHDILVLASNRLSDILKQNENEPKWKESNIQWYNRIHWILDSLHAGRNKAIDKHNSLFGCGSVPQPRSLKQILQENKRERDWLNEIIQAVEKDRNEGNI